eukprot:GHUV01020545.1.p1 GENE.GHUV01020545.1~~GHUV01020545.1.p1  ORF type:complete len:289 (+),score=95.13 GHUV01020545.1:1287-2153(+)
MSWLLDSLCDVCKSSIYQAMCVIQMVMLLSGFLARKACDIVLLAYLGCVVFEDAASTRRAIAGTGHPLTQDELSTAPDSLDEHMMDLDPAVNMPYLWHKGRDFYKRTKDAKGKDLEIKIPLMYRMATDLDQKDPHAEKRSRYLWKGKRRFEDYQQGQQQQQRGRGHGRRQQQHAAAAATDQWHEEEQGYQDGDVEMQQVGGRGRGRRGGRRVRQRQPHDGDVDMQDAEYDGEAADAVATDEAAADPEGDRDAKALREMLKQRDAARRAAEEDLPYEEIPQSDEDEQLG